MTKLGSTRAGTVLGILGASLFLALAASAQDIPTGPIAAERAVVLYEGGSFALQERVSLRTVMPPFDRLPNGGREYSGFWYEVQDVSGAVRYRRMMGNPLRVAFEGPEPNGGENGDANGERRTPVRFEYIPDRKVFSLLIPAALQGDQLVIFSSPLKPGAQHLAAEEVARLDLLPVVIP
jgi:hypothetical protein